MVKLSIKWKLVSIGLCLIIIPSLLIGLFIYNKIYSGVIEMIEHSMRKQTGNWETIATATIGEVKLYKQTMGQTADYDVNYEKKQQEALKNIIAKEIIGKTGYVFVLDSEGNYIVSKDRKRDGEWIWEEKDADGRFFIQEMIKKAKESIKTKNLPIIYYPWKNIGETAARSKFAVLTYIPEWDWIIGVIAYQDDFFDQLYAVRNITAIVLVLSIIIGTVILLLFVRRIIKPVNDLHRATEEVMKGNLDVKVNVPLVPCWKMKKCEKKECLVYGKGDYSCWYVAGTMCEGVVQGTYAEKIKDCRKCEVYQKYSGDEIQQLSESFNIMVDNLKNARTNLEEKIKVATEDIKKANIELKEKNKTLETVNKELDSFTYSASHDLKEPLRGIASFSQFLLEDYLDKLDETGKDYLKRLSASANRMKSLIDDLLSLSRISRIENPYTSVDSNKLIKEILKRLKPMIEEKNVQLKVDEKLPFIFCDEIKIKEVFHNLISNAIKYNDKKRPEIEIGIEEKIGEGVEGLDSPLEKGVRGLSQPVFFVRDNGIGIEEKYLEEIFGIFKRLHKGDEYGGGTGAGLAIVKRVITDHGGNVWVKSSPGEGSTFYFSLPKTDPEIPS
ncbi:MAG: Cache 3/Cache 2 fusion domain-containing protein [Nitrospirota bacterium]